MQWTRFGLQYQQFDAAENQDICASSVCTSGKHNFFSTKILNPIIGRTQAAAVVAVCITEQFGTYVYIAQCAWRLLIPIEINPPFVYYTKQIVAWYKRINSHKLSHSTQTLFIAFKVPSSLYHHQYKNDKLNRNFFLFSDSILLIPMTADNSKAKSNFRAILIRLLIDWCGWSIQRFETMLIQFHPIFLQWKVDWNSNGFG